VDKIKVSLTVLDSEYTYACDSDYISDVPNVMDAIIQFLEYEYGEGAVNNYIRSLAEDLV